MRTDFSMMLELAGEMGMRAGLFGIVEQSEVTERLLNGWLFFRRAQLALGPRRACGHGQADQLLTVGNPGTLRHKSVLTNDPLLDFLIGSSLTGRVAHREIITFTKKARGRHRTGIRVQNAVAWRPTLDLP